MTTHQNDLNSSFSKEATKTNNGKLIVREEVGIEGVKTKLKDLTKQLESVEQTRTAIQKQQQQEMLERINTIQSSFYKVEQVYRRLLAATIVVTVSFGVLLLWMNINRSECSASLSKVTTSSEANKTETYL